jgi:hypothetical protein
MHLRQALVLESLIGETWFEAFLIDFGLGPNEWSCGFRCSP